MRLKLHPAAVLQASNGALCPRGVFWLVLFWGRSSRACPSGQGQQPWRERQVCGSFPGRSTMTEGPGVWLGKVKRCLGRGSEHSWKRMEGLRSAWSGSGLALVGVFRVLSPFFPADPVESLHIQPSLPRGLLLGVGGKDHCSHQGLCLLVSLWEP